MSRLKPLPINFLTRIIAFIYAFIVFLRNLWYDSVPWAVKRSGGYTLSIGSIHAGGTGKTPLTALIGAYFQKNKYEVIVLSRGYGRQAKREIIVSPQEHLSWKEIGDEPVMLHHALPGTWLGIGAKRLSTAKQVQARVKKKAVYILDDGFQHRQLFRHKDIVCLHANTFNDFLIPAGYLREPFSALKRADIVCLIGNHLDHAKLIALKDNLNKRYTRDHTPIFILYQKPEKWVHLRNGSETLTPPLKTPLLLSGIAKPHRFLQLVHEQQITPYKCVHYEDHHGFEKTEIDKIWQSEMDGIITTEKDAMRLSTIIFEKWINIWYLKIKLVFSDVDSENEFFQRFK